MTHFMLQYPIVAAGFFISAVSAGLTGVLRSYGFAAGLVAGTATVFWIAGALVCRIPLEIILALILTELLICCLAFRKGES